MTRKSRYDAAMTGVLQRLPEMIGGVAAERTAAARFLARFDLCSPTQQQVMVANRARYGRAVVDGILERARAAAHRDPDECRRLADLALLALSRAELMVPGREGVEVLAHAEVANALRIQGQLHAAARTWDRIDSLDAIGELDPLETARILSLRASFDLGRRAPQMAASRLRRAVTLISEHGDRLGLVRALVKLSPVLQFTGEADESLRVAHEACRMLQPDDSGELRLYAVHNLAFAADQLGEARLAESVIVSAQRLYRRFGGELDLLRRDWLLARCRIARHELAVAEPMLERVAAEFAERRMLYEVSMVGLDQIGLWAEQERWEPLRRRATALVQAFVAVGVKPEAIAALIALRQATRRRDVEPVLVRLAAALRGAECLTSRRR